eukprot:CAMPEP_0170569682 /NCGR_PEP_ID=MMETSP0224-20130122/693_1 /TAXON_ID=285029 /ORGANISM="Togula jolla, Strain CCCM 725" /LENGTH=247 /DNA_ID=CAMNT_0010891881 /DNA_START=66 /DNA_END=810 /DNA_ORIENTATION=-
MVVACDAQMVSCNNGWPITYEVCVRLPFGVQWVVTRRYTDFERLRRALGSRSLQCELPPKALLVWLRPRLRDRRHEALARFLAEVMSSFPYQENDELARFLGVSIPQPSGLDVVNDELEVLIERSTERLPRRPGRSNLLEVAAQEAAWSAQIEQWMERLARRRRRRYLALLEVAAPEAAWSAELQAQMQLEQLVVQCAWKISKRKNQFGICLAATLSIPPASMCGFNAKLTVQYAGAACDFYHELEN